jgi:hypothetical protein
MPEDVIIERKSVWVSMKEKTNELLTLTEENKLKALGGTVAGSAVGYGTGELISYINASSDNPNKNIQDNQLFIKGALTFIGGLFGCGLMGVHLGKNKGKKEEVLKNIDKYTMELLNLEQEPESDANNKLKNFLQKSLKEQNDYYDLL